MKEILAQFTGKAFFPYTARDEEDAAEFKTNQICRLQIYGAEKARSAPQLKMFWVLCKRVTENTDDQHWNTEEKVAGQVKVALNFIDMSKTFVDPQGNVHLHYRSISYKELKHMEACRFFDRAWPVLANKIGITVDELLKNQAEQI
jgi:hypothetical protein